MKNLKRKEFDSDIKILKGFYKKETEVRHFSVNNLYFLYFLERDFNLGEYYADIVVKTIQYNAKALVNKGTCFFIKSDFAKSK